MQKLRRNLFLITADPNRLANILEERRSKIYKPTDNVKKSTIPLTYVAPTTTTTTNGVPPHSTAMSQNILNDAGVPPTVDNLSMFGDNERNYYTNKGEIFLLLKIPSCKLSNLQILQNRITTHLLRRCEKHLKDVKNVRESCISFFHFYR